MVSPDGKIVIFMRSKNSEMVSKIVLLGLLITGCAGCRSSQPPQRGDRESSVFDSLVGRRELTLVFSGDVMQHMPQVRAAQQPDGSYDYTACFRYIRPFWEAADFAIVNLETTLAEREPYSGYPCFASPEALAAALREAGVDVAVLANNHCCDRGGRGVRNTVRAVDSLGLAYAGVYMDSAAAERPLMLERQGFRVAVLNCTYGTNGLPVPEGTVVHGIDTVRMAREAEAARRDSATHLVLFVHWGEEYRRQPTDAQRELAAWCRRQGFDAVIGSHPHVAQPIDTAAGVAWSLGNFVSNQRERYRDGGLSVRVTLSLEGRRPRIESLPHWVWIRPKERGGREYVVVPAYVSGREIGMDSATNERFVRALEDNRRTAGAVEEVVL